MLGRWAHSTYLKGWRHWCSGCCRAVLCPPHKRIGHRQARTLLGTAMLILGRTDYEHVVQPHTFFVWHVIFRCRRLGWSLPRWSVRCFGPDGFRWFVDWDHLTGFLPSCQIRNILLDHHCWLLWECLMGIPASIVHHGLSIKVSSWYIYSQHIAHNAPHHTFSHPHIVHLYTHSLSNTYSPDIWDKM